MPNITLSIPPGVYKKMKKHKEVKWSEVARKAIIEYLEKLDEGALEVPGEQLLEELGEDFVKELKNIPDEKFEEYYEKAREAEWKRLKSFMTRTY